MVQKVVWGEMYIKFGASSCRTKQMWPPFSELKCRDENSSQFKGEVLRQ